MSRRDLHPRAWWALALVPLVAASCSSGSPPTAATPDSTLQGADATVLTAIHRYLGQASSCTSASSPVVCLEAADKSLGGKIHAYANFLVKGRGFTAPPADLKTALYAAQNVADSLEILGDAQPTQANYDQVLNTFNVNAALSQLEDAVTKVNGTLRS